MAGEAADEAVLLREDGVLELHHRGESMLTEENPRDVDLTIVFVGFAPLSDGIEVFEGEPERVDVVVAATAVGPFAVHREALAEGEMLLTL